MHPSGTYLAAMHRSSILRQLLLIALLFSCTFASAQPGTEGELVIDGHAKNYADGHLLPGVSITVSTAGRPDLVVLTDDSGRYEVALTMDRLYRIAYGRQDMVTKRVELDARNVPVADREIGMAMTVDMTLFAPMEGVDLSFLDEPIGKARYVVQDSMLVWDLAYTDSIRGLIADRMREYDHLQAEAKIKEEQGTTQRSRSRRIFKLMGGGIAVLVMLFGWWRKRRKQSDPGGMA